MDKSIIGEGTQISGQVEEMEGIKEIIVQVQNERERKLEQGMSSIVSKPSCTICKKSSHSSSECWHRGKPQCQT